VLLAILDYRGYAYVAKREFQENFLMRALLSGFGTQFIERFDVAKSTEHASELAEAAKRGVSLIVFPEGTLSATPADGVSAPAPSRPRRRPAFRSCRCAARRPLGAARRHLVPAPRRGVGDDRRADRARGATGRGR
jgi:1-acyl-sn-glycerol-3-phosphate acyltransferase